ncbi:MAG: hypothetical protein AAFQ57_10275, partial [Cyanobacteria bacterium J06626_14]
MTTCNCVKYGSGMVGRSALHHTLLHRCVQRYKSKMKSWFWGSDPHTIRHSTSHHDHHRVHCLNHSLQSARFRITS